MRKERCFVQKLPINNVFEGRYTHNHKKAIPDLSTGIAFPFYNWILQSAIFAL